MWRGHLNSAVLPATIHRGLKGVSDGIGTQVGIQMINKCKVQIIRKELFNMEEPHDKRGRRKKRRRDESKNTVAC